ncbi:MAG: CoA transferase, partial [Dehalococcoidia bacterium]|nr:CoA transferase [Dehalococcoidia bacterium]
RATGKGQYIDVSIQECVAAGLDHTMVRYFSEGVVSRRSRWNRETRGFRLFPCRDGYVLLSLFQDWEVLVEWLDSEGMAGDLTDEKWRSQETRLDGMAHVAEVLEEWTRSHTAAELVEKGQLMRFPWAKAVSVPELVGNPQLRDRGFFVRVGHPELGTSYEYPGATYWLEHAATPPRRAPLIGEDNHAIYCGDLGLSEAELASLRERGVV